MELSVLAFPVLIVFLVVRAVFRHVGINGILMTFAAIVGLAAFGGMMFFAGWLVWTVLTSDGKNPMSAFDMLVVMPIGTLIVFAIMMLGKK